MAFDLSKNKILIIDDFAQMRQQIKRMLESYQIGDIDDCGTGEEAIVKMRKKNYDIVMCDYNLGEGKDGQQVLEEAKHEGLLDYSSIFMMITAENTVSMVMAAVEFEPDDYLTKPFTKEVLLKRLERIWERKSALRNIGKATNRKDYPRAITLCDQLLKEKPKNALDLLKTKADLYLTVQDYDNAIQVYNSVLNIHCLPWAKAGLGKALYYKQQLHEARLVFDELIHEAPHFVVAMDWLAKVYLSLNDPIQAQAILEQASLKSPKVILRRQSLGDIAFHNNDMETAEHSYKAAIKLGRGSQFKRTDEYTHLAKIYTQQKMDQKALSILKQARDEFAGNPDVTLQIMSIEGSVHHSVGRHDAAVDTLNRAMRLFEAEKDTLSAHAALELARTTLLYGDKASGLEIIKRVVNNNHEDADILRKARHVMIDSGIEAGEADLIIRNAVNQVININNEGARLANAGKLQEAIKLFEDAAQHMPQNKVVNINTAQALIIYMKKHGPSDTQLKSCRRYLNCVENVAPNDPKLLSLNESFIQLEARLKISAESQRSEG